jgi:hypothetical protein
VEVVTLMAIFKMYLYIYFLLLFCKIHQKLEKKIIMDTVQVYSAERSSSSHYLSTVYAGRGGCLGPRSTLNFCLCRHLKIYRTDLYI